MLKITKANNVFFAFETQFFRAFMKLRVDFSIYAVLQITVSFKLKRNQQGIWNKFLVLLRSELLLGCNLRADHVS